MGAPVLDEEEVASEGHLQLVANGGDWGGGGVI